MIKKWFFSNNLEIIGPLDLRAAKKYLLEYPNVYGWHPSFTQWKPVSCIDEFSAVLPPVIQAPLIPKEISEQFLAKQQRLEGSLITINNNLKKTQYSLNEFDKKIAEYKTLTKDLNGDIKNAIDNVEIKYSSLKSKLSQIGNAVNIADKEMLDAVDTFDSRMNSNNIFMPSCNQGVTIKSRVNKRSTVYDIKSHSHLVQEKVVITQPSVKAEAQKKPERTYRGAPILKSDKSESRNKTGVYQQTYRGVPVLKA